MLDNHGAYKVDGELPKQGALALSLCPCISYVSLHNKLPQI